MSGEEGRRIVVIEREANGCKEEIRGQLGSPKSLKD